jgi:hypothetical protein
MDGGCLWHSACGVVFWSGTKKPPVRAVTGGLRRSLPFSFRRVEKLEVTFITFSHSVAERSLFNQLAVNFWVVPAKARCFDCNVNIERLPTIGQYPIYVQGDGEATDI